MRIVVKGGPSSGWYAPPEGTHSGEEHRAVGSGMVGSGEGSTDLSGWRARAEHSGRVLANLDALKGKFAKFAYTDDKEVTYTVMVRQRRWVTGKYVAGTTKQQRYALEMVLRARDKNGKGWKEVVAKTAARRHDTYDLLNSKDLPSMQRKIKKLFGIEDRVYITRQKDNIRPGGA